MEATVTLLSVVAFLVVAAVTSIKVVTAAIGVAVRRVEREAAQVREDEVAADEEQETTMDVSYFGGRCKMSFDFGTEIGRCNALNMMLALSRLDPIARRARA